mmetsp:Transcript_29298/g.61306  ORF Transcript_29298/g.61306 Transcript_29298/m.61306 type:complete len:218 (-) Transcript_29298:506-1159(-)|eukprot:CAMPEP_0172440646 /NCGR_PEP_ID=MMETSP1065-20121228/1292_1 /TAXON_ID=265537 /ORGANISM="Amphiprora paludosa, Strain CCMP125" /LENGTH=217 /DNA_ID=CAMNT_0013189609 /DNA_START=209 /DNA_END=862 /DNA_ORIENTATION=+
MSTKGLLLFLVVVCLAPMHNAFAPVAPSIKRQQQSSSDAMNTERQQPRSHETVLFAGFGGSGGDAKKKKETKLKPKQQWDRFLEMKNEQKFRVAVRVTDDEEEEWLEVGNVRSKGDKYTAAAVFRQRALVVEHARRLFPLRISQKDQVLWAFWNEEPDEWILVDKSAVEDKKIPSTLEKVIGFEGRPDPSTGYYCVYNEGRLVNDNDDARPSSKKLK